MALLDDDEVIEGGRVGCRRVRVVAHVGPSTRATQWLIERAVDVGADAPTRRFGFPASTRSPAPRWKVSTKIEGLHREEAWDALLQRLGDLDRAMVAPLAELVAERQVARKHQAESHRRCHRQADSMATRSAPSRSRAHRRTLGGAT
jgi:hypothetical protein